LFESFDIELLPFIISCFSSLTLLIGRQERHLDIRHILKSRNHHFTAKCVSGHIFHAVQ